MRKITCLMLIIFLSASVNLWAREKKDKGAKESRKSSEPAYAIVGVTFPFLYFITMNDSSGNLGLVFKLPVTNNYGIEIGATTFTIPITSYSLGTASYTGFGTESYTGVNLNFIYFLPVYRYLQLRVGLDYYRYIRGNIASSPTGAHGGTVYTEHYNTQKNHFGLNAGVNLDIHVHKESYVMTGITYRYLLSSHDSTTAGILEIKVGLGRKILK